MKLANYDQPLPVGVGRILLFLNAVVGLVAINQIVMNNPQTAAYVTLAAGILNQAVHIFIGQNPTHEQTTDSTLSNRRERVRKEKGPTRSNRKGGDA